MVLTGLARLGIALRVIDGRRSVARCASSAAASSSASTKPLSARVRLHGAEWQEDPSWATPLEGREKQAAIEELTAFLASSERLLIITGAGLSTGSGIPDCRGPQPPPAKVPHSNDARFARSLNRPRAAGELQDRPPPHEPPGVHVVPVHAAALLGAEYFRMGSTGRGRAEPRPRSHRAAGGGGEGTAHHHAK